MVTSLSENMGRVRSLDTRDHYAQNMSLRRPVFFEPRGVTRQEVHV